MHSHPRMLFSGLAVAGVIALSALALAADRAVPAAGHSEHNGGFAKCAQVCSDCQRECDACAHHCALQLAAGHKDHMATMQNCHDCAILCTAAAQIVAGQGVFSTLACNACAEACDRCAKECEKMPDDKMMARCAEECRRCEKACREMVKLATLN